MTGSSGIAQKTRYLVEVVQKLSLVRGLPELIDIVRKAARELTGADGATFVLSEGEMVYYADEDAIGPLWKGRRFPAKACISGWAIAQKTHAVIEDVFQDPRIPVDVYAPTFVKSLLMVPIRKDAPIGAIGNYWSRNHRATEEEVELLQSLADSASIAFQNVRLYGELSSAKEMLERQLKLRDDFISIVAHELKTPLSPAVIQSQFLKRMLEAGDFTAHPQEDQLRKFSEVTARQLSELSRLVEDLLDVSRISFGRISFREEEGVCLSECARRVADRYKPVAAARVSLRLTERALGRWDRLRLEQVIENLLSNALKYGEEKSVEISSGVRQGFAWISVRDYGPGIAEADRERVFERFERAASLRSFGGLGLGLYIVREIVAGMGGEIRLECPPEGGAIFRVELPIQRESVVPARLSQVPTLV